MSVTQSSTVCTRALDHTPLFRIRNPFGRAVLWCVVCVGSICTFDITQIDLGCCCAALQSAIDRCPNPFSHNWKANRREAGSDNCGNNSSAFVVGEPEPINLNIRNLYIPAKHVVSRYELCGGHRFGTESAGGSGRRLYTTTTRRDTISAVGGGTGR